MAIGKISSIKKQFSNDTTTLGSVLAEKGYSRAPGTKMGISPYMEPTGEYRTGLDPNAKYIKLMDEKDAAIERAKISDWCDYIKLNLGDDFDVTGRGSFYKDMYNPAFAGDTKKVCTKAYLGDGDTFFDLENPFALIQFAYLRVHPLFIARSYQDILQGKARDTVKYYVNDEEHEQKMAYNEELMLNKAVTVMGELGYTDKIRIARLMGINISYTSPEEIVYNQLSKFLKNATSPIGDRLANVKLFNKFIAMAPETLKIRSIIDQAISYNVLRSKNGVMYDGQTELAKNLEDLVIFYSKPKNQSQLEALETRVAQLRVAEV